MLWKCFISQHYIVNILQYKLTYKMCLFTNGASAYCTTCTKSAQLSEKILKKERLKMQRCFLGCFFFF